MKIILTILFAFLFFSCKQETAFPTTSPPQTKVFFYMSKTPVGFNLYSNKGELILEYTKRNLDSASLDLLNDIYETAIEFNNTESSNENDSTNSQIKAISYVRE